MTTKFRIVYQNDVYTIQKGIPLLGFLTIWRTMKYLFSQHPDMEFGVRGIHKPYEFHSIHTAKKYLRKFQKGEL